MDLAFVAAAFVLGFIASLVRLPPLVGYLAAGFVLHGFGFESTPGIELVADQKTSKPSPDAANMLLEEARSRGMLIGKGGFYGNVIRIAPPLIVTEADVDEALEILDDAMNHLHGVMSE